MDAVKFIEERGRMCKATNGDCSLCPLNNWCGRGIKRQSDFAANIVSAVEAWSAAHPRKTRQSVFLEQYPEAILDSQGILCICPENVYGNAVCPKNEEYVNIICYDCRRDFWSQEVE